MKPIWPTFMYKLTTNRCNNLYGFITAETEAKALVSVSKRAAKQYTNLTGVEIKRTPKYNNPREMWEASK